MELITTYTNSGFLDFLAGLSPAVGGGVILGLIFAVIGWLFGLVINFTKFD